MRNGNKNGKWRLLYGKAYRLHPPLLTSEAKDHDAKPTCTELRTVLLRNHNKLFV